MEDLLALTLRALVYKFRACLRLLMEALQKNTIKVHKVREETWLCSRFSPFWFFLFCAFAGRTKDILKVWTIKVMPKLSICQIQWIYFVWPTCLRKTNTSVSQKSPLWPTMKARTSFQDFQEILHRNVSGLVEKLHVPVNWHHFLRTEFWIFWSVHHPIATNAYFKDTSRTRALPGVLRMKECRDLVVQNQSPIRSLAQQWRKERRVMMKNGCMWWTRSTWNSPWEQQSRIRFPNPKSHLYGPSAGREENWPQVSIYSFFSLFHGFLLYHIPHTLMYVFFQMRLKEPLCDKVMRLSCYQSQFDNQLQWWT